MNFTELAGDMRLAASVAATAAGTAVQQPISRLQNKITVTGVVWTPGAAMTANDTNYVTLTLRNRGAAGAGTTTLATRAYTVAGGNSVAGQAEVLTLSATAADLLGAVGDVLTAQFTHTASGLAIPAGLIEVIYRLR